MADNTLVIGVFQDEAAADAAVASLADWDKINDAVDLGAIGVLVTDDRGRIKEHKLGARSTKTGAGIGLVLAVVAPPTLLAGIVGGGILGHFHHRGLRMSSEDRERLAGVLREGRAAVGVLMSSGQPETVALKLHDLGGAVETHEVSDEALKEMAAVTTATPQVAE